MLAARGDRKLRKHREKGRLSQPRPGAWHTHGFEGIAADEAVRLIEELRDHATQERFVYYHAWRVGDVVMWDEIATMHRGAGDARPEERRIMLRTIVHPF